MNEVNKRRTELVICGKTVDELFAFSRDNPEEFKRWHTQQMDNLIRKLATNSDRKKKYLFFQWEIDEVIREHGNSLGVAIALNRMLRDKQFDLVRVWKPLPGKLVDYFGAIKDVFNPERKGITIH